MSHPLMRLHKTFPLFLSACCLSLPLTQGGCEGDVDAADKQVRDHIAEGRQKADAAVTAAPNVPDAYKKAAGVTNASPAAKVEALSRLAEAERDRAVALMTEAEHMGGDLLRLIGSANRQAARIQSNNTLAAGLARMEPTKASQAIEAQRRAVEGEQNAVWVGHETGPIPARKGLEEQIKQLEEQIGQLEGQGKDLAAQRSKLIGDAEQTERQSEQAQGQESSELYTQSVDARKQAADLAVQAEAVEAKLLPLRQDLERAQANQQLVAKTVETFGGQLQATQQNWQKVQEQIAELQKLNQRILNGTGGTEPAAAAPAPAAAQPGSDTAVESGGGAAPSGAPAAPVAPSIVGKLGQINQLVAQIEARRGEAESLLKSAIEHANQASAAAGNVVSSVGAQMSASGGSQRPERAAWQRMSELHNPARFKLKHASLQILLADLLRARAADLATRANMVQMLTAALQPAQLQVPAEAGGANLQAEADAARTASIALYGEAESELRDVVQAPRSGDLMADTAKAAHLMQLVRLYAQAQADPQTAAGLAAKARTLAAEGDTIEMPASSLPSFVQDALELRAPPATGPATRPGAGAATPPAGAAPPATPPATPDAATPPGGTPPGTATPPGVTPPPGGADPTGAATPAGASTPAAGDQPAPAPEAAPTPEQ